MYVMQEVIMFSTCSQHEITRYSILDILRVVNRFFIVSWVHVRQRPGRRFYDIPGPLWKPVVRNGFFTARPWVVFGKDVSKVQGLFEQWRIPWILFTCQPDVLF